MYTKTQWVDNTTPIDKDNLNKIEQGIYDNSLVVDAVTNTLNPTDTETYKTAELTEGQITDVIGVNDIVIKGQTLQDGTPTPSAPVDVNVVSGSNVINTGNENLFPLILNIDGTSILQQRCNVIIQKDEFVFTATGTDMYFGNVATANSDYQKLQGKLIKIPANAQNIYLKVSNNAFSNNFICFFDENKVSLGYSNISTSKEVPNTAKYFTLRIGVSNSVSGTTYKTKVMVSTMNKAYIPHQGKELPLDLPVENLLDGIFESGDINSSNGADESNNNRIRTKNYIKVPKNSSIIMSILNQTAYSRLVFYDENKNFISTTFGNNVPYTFTTGEASYIRFSVNTTNIDIKAQVEKGSKANAYTPYGTEPIELCKIGNYQDYFYKSGSKWYLHKEIGKVVLDGSRNSWVKSGASTDALLVASLALSTENIYSKETTGSLWLTDRFLAGTDLGQENKFFAYNQDTTWGYRNIAFTLSTSIASDINAFKTWLNSNNVSLYYMLKNATDTEITNITLISQLEAIYNAPLYEQTNITQTNNDLPMILDITACKDNINGIKAFIRK